MTPQDVGIVGIFICLFAANLCLVGLERRIERLEQASRTAGAAEGEKDL